jgi:hypothetical protein
VRERLAELRQVILTLEAQLAALEAELVARVREQVLPKGLGEITTVSLEGEVCDWQGVALTQCASRRRRSGPPQGVLPGRTQQWRETLAGGH